MNGQERLIYMANQIARNFGAMRHDDAVAATADHIHLYWDPRMKAKLFADSEGLGAVAAAALEQLKAGTPPPPQTPASTFSAVDGVGSSDAG